VIGIADGHYLRSEFPGLGNEGFRIVVGGKRQGRKAAGILADYLQRLRADRSRGSEDSDIFLSVFQRIETIRFD
jgi:hypothetical protein